MNDQLNNIKCNGVIQILGTDVSEKYFRTKSVSALHPTLPVYFNILSPGLDPYSNFEILIIIFEDECLPKDASALKKPIFLL